MDGALWSDHTDIEPTMMAALGLRNDYQPDGRVLTEILNPSRLPAAVRAHRALFVELGQAYSQIEAPVGAFGLATLRASTRALESKSAGDHEYKQIESKLASLGAQRDRVAAQMRDILLGTVFGGHPLNTAKARSLIHSADVLLKKAAVLAA